MYQKEDFSEVTFGVSKIDSSTVNYYYEIKSDKEVKNMRINKFKNKISILISTMMLLSFGSTSLADSVIDISNLPPGKGVAVGNQLPVNSQSSDGNIVVDNGTKLSVCRIAGKNRYETSYKVSVALGEYKNNTCTSIYTITI